MEVGLIADDTVRSGTLPALLRKCLVPARVMTQQPLTGQYQRQHVVLTDSVGIYPT